MNDDYTGLDYYYSEQEVDNRIKEIKDGLDRLGVGLCMSLGEKEHSIDQCDCCYSPLHGKRQQFILLG